MILIKKSRAMVPAHPFRHARSMAAALSMVLVLLASACTQAPVRQTVVGSESTQAAREAALKPLSSWSLVGRLAVSQGSNGGSARIQWRQEGDDFDITLSAPVTRQSWRLHRSGGRTRLEGMDGGIREGEDAREMLRDATGWDIPLEAMTSWVRGVRAQGPADLSFNDQGLPASITQQGWAVEFRSWFGAEPALPERVFAKQGAASVRLVIDRWN